MDKFWNVQNHCHSMKNYTFYRHKKIFTLFENSNFCPKIQFWQNPNIFTSFSPKFFLTIFLVKSKLSTAKKSKTTTFSRVFHPNKIDNFHGKSKLNFWTKNEDFEQCDIVIKGRIRTRDISVTTSKKYSKRTMWVRIPMDTPIFSMSE